MPRTHGRFPWGIEPVWPIGRRKACRLRRRAARDYSMCRIVSATSVVLVEAVVVVEVDVLASVLAEPVQSCGVASLRGSGVNHDPSFDHPTHPLRPF